MNTRWDEQNCHAQCTMCNIFKHGNMPEYALALQRKYGDGILKELHEKKQRIRQFSMQELTDLIAKYSEDKGT